MPHTRTLSVFTTWNRTHTASEQCRAARSDTLSLSLSLSPAPAPAPAPVPARAPTAVAVAMPVGQLTQHQLPVSVPCTTTVYCTVTVRLLYNVWCARTVQWCKLSSDELPSSYCTVQLQYTALHHCYVYSVLYQSLR